MNCFSQVYRQACSEINLPAYEQCLFMKLLREMSINAVKYQRVWYIKEDFITMWFISVGRFPELINSSYSNVISNWMYVHLPFELFESERRLLWI